MATYLYKPDHPDANERGMVEKSAYYYRKFMLEEDKRMMRGNEPVVIHYIADEMAPTRHMALPSTAPLYTSKRKFRNETRARGLIEVGTDIEAASRPKQYIPPSSRGERREAIRQTLRSYKENTINEGEREITRKQCEATDYYNRNRPRKG